MNLFAPVGHRRAILLTAPSAVRDDSTTSLLSFIKWARETVPAPPRVVKCPRSASATTSCPWKYT